MKTTKVILAATLIGVASLSAQAGGFLGISFGTPAPVIVRPAPVVVVAPARVVYAPAPVYYQPAPVVVVQPPCPGVGYVWTAGYWTTGPQRVWVAGNWHRPANVVVQRGPARYGWHHH